MDFSELWVEKWRPKTLKDILLTKDIRDFFEHLEKQDEKSIPHLLLIGPAGTGKTTLAKIIVNDLMKCQYLYLNASDQNSIETVRGVITNFIQTKSIDGSMKVVLLDEVDGMSKASGTGSSAQQALRNIMEEYSAYCRFVLTANYAHMILEPIMSRVQTFYVCPDQKDFTIRCIEILKKENIVVPTENKKFLLKMIDGYYPDLRKCINEMQKFSFTGTFQPPSVNIDQEIIDIAGNCWKMLVEKTDIVEIRKYIIEKEKNFKADYQILLKKLFEEVYKSDIKIDLKKVILLYIGEALVNHPVVLDREINMFCCLIKISSKI